MKAISARVGQVLLLWGCCTKYTQAHASGSIREAGRREPCSEREMLFIYSCCGSVRCDSEKMKMLIPRKKADAGDGHDVVDHRLINTLLYFWADRNSSQEHGTVYTVDRHSLLRIAASGDLYSLSRREGFGCDTVPPLYTLSSRR
jgi:hypothetical protein